MTHNQFLISSVTLRTLPRKTKNSSPILYLIFLCRYTIYYIILLGEYRSKKHFLLFFFFFILCSSSSAPFAIFSICFFQFATLVIANIAESRLCGTAYTVHCQVTSLMVAVLPVCAQQCTISGRDRARECRLVFLGIILLRSMKIPDRKRCTIILLTIQPTSTRYSYEKK